MRGLVFFFFFLLLAFTGFSQVGINTTNPSEASVLDVKSSSDGTNFGGFLPPRVSLAERDLIPVTAADEGMLVYVLNAPNSQLQIWDGTAWQAVFPQNIEFSAALASWEMAGLAASGPNPFASTESSSTVTIGGLTKGPAIGDAGAGSAWGGNNWFDTGTDLPQDAITAGSYITFTISPNFGINLSISTIEPYNIRRSSTGPTIGLLQYSLDGLNFIDIGSDITWGATTDGTGNPQVAIDLSGIADLQNLTSTTTVTFRIVNWGASGTTGAWYINNQVAGPDFIIRGNVK